MIGTRQGEGTTTIGRGASLRGDLKTTGDIVIEGSLEGSLEAEGARVTVGSEALVRANVVAREVVIEGKIFGTVRATERVELRANASLEGDVFAKRFAMEENSVLRGRVDPSLATEVAGNVEKPKAVAIPAGAPIPITRLAVQEVLPATESSPLFNASRPTGSMPAGLAAAARNIGSGATTGLGALASGDPHDDEA